LSLRTDYQRRSATYIELDQIWMTPCSEGEEGRHMRLATNTQRKQKQKQNHSTMAPTLNVRID
jgi:hypothetical protein